MQNIRRPGPDAFDSWLLTYGAAPSPALDRLCAQKDAHTALLYWFTDLDAALAHARRTSKPILSLRLLGLLTDELSCANSRFFRKLLYPDAAINRVLREQFVLHWQSVRAVPKVTIELGDGRRIVRTLTGNSAHLVLDGRGRPVDVLPGLFDRDTFLALLEQASRFAYADPRELSRLHDRARGRTLPPIAPSRAVAASRIAPTKHMVEAPLLRAVTSDVPADTRENLALHDRVHEAFAAGAEWAGLDGLVEWIYAELFAMPLSDPALGLDVRDPFDASEKGSDPIFVDRPRKPVAQVTDLNGAMRILVLWLVVACSSASTRAATRDDAPIAGMDSREDPRRWFAGDMHMHVAPPDSKTDVMLSVAEIAAAAARAGMDFVVLTPHLWTWRWQSDRDDWRQAWRELAAATGAIQSPTLIPGVEWTTRDGHFTVAGVDLASLDGNDFLAAADAAGAWISVNHPFAMPTKIPGVRASHYDMSYRVWTEHRAGFSAIDGAEVWNVPLALANLISRPRGHTAEELTWAELDRVVHAEHRRVTAVAGTDNHQTNVMATTWVFAISTTATAILEALRDGATCIGGPEAGTLRARGDGEWVAIGGDVIGPLTTLAWNGTARVFVDNINQGEYTDQFTHPTGGALHTYRIELGTSRSGFIYANL